MLKRIFTLALAAALLLTLVPLSGLQASAAQSWSFTYYGPSTKAEMNGYEGSVDAGSVTVYSEGGKGKIQPKTVDGLAFYYTAIPTNHNFTLRATVTVDSWTYSNGQEGFGLLVADRLGTMGDTGSVWNNSYMALASKIEYRYDADLEEIHELEGTGTKYTMKLGLGVLAKSGVTKENLPKFEANDTEVITKEFISKTYSLEASAGEWSKDGGTYNLIGNCTNEAPADSSNKLLTTFDLEIQKNNTGYFITYYDEAGNVLRRQKFYDPEALNQLDEDYVYAGFFAARNARATFTDVKLTTIPCKDDAPAEEKPVIKIEPTVAITSPTITTSLDYDLCIDSNVAGVLKITVDGKEIADADEIRGLVRYHRQLQLKQFGENRIQVRFTPDPDQDLGPDTVLSSKNPIYLDTTILCNKGNYHRKVIYVAPDGLPNGNGSREYPYDIQTAVNNVVAGQTIVLLEGTYKLRASLRIQRGMDGTAEKPICMVADPEAKTRPVIDFQKLSAGIVHGGDYWYFRGFDVTNSADTQKGFQVSGNYNVLDQINTYRNGNTGIQISRYAGTDLFPDWPAHNLILNCTSYYNADPGFEDADGFAAKLTCGEGNVFDGCVAYNNADDGWDLYAKLETGSIGAVTIRNCVAYNNGFLPDSTKNGNGNGFKLGGDSLSGKHVLENCYAFFNLSKGIDSNSCPDIIVRNCVSYNNGRYNVAFYTNNAAHTDFFATGIISFKDSTSPYAGDLEKDNLKPKGNQDTTKYVGSTNYYWNGSICSNSDGVSLGADVFKSLEFKGIVRKADGTIDMQGFLERTDRMPADAGVNMGGQASEAVVIPAEDGEHTYSEVWFNEDNMFHWHECECGDKTDMGEHDLIWVTDREVTAEQNGLRHQECTVCGHKKPAVEVYPEKPVDPTVPTESTPATEPSAPAQPGGQEEPEGPNGSIIAVIAVVVLLAAAVAAVLLRRKKKA